MRKVTVCGLGLIGGSIARDIRKQASSVKIVAYDRAKVLDAFTKKPFSRITVEKNFKKAVTGSDMIILAAPHKANEMMLSRLGKERSLTDCLIIDTGAVKKPITQLGLSLSFAEGTMFLPTHPMAGREKAGFENSAEGLFKDHAWYVSEDVNLSKDAQKKLAWLIAVTGSKKVEIRSSLHDELVSEISHLPQLLSTILGGQINPALIPLAGPGLKSMLRLAGSPYSVWKEIIAENKEEIIESLCLYRENLSRVIEQIETDESLATVFKDASRSYTCLS